MSCINMKKIVTCFIIGSSMLAAANAQTTAVSSSLRPTIPRHVLSNEGIVQLSEAGYDQNFLVNLIQQKQTRFDTSVEGLAFLAEHGIPENIVRFMIANENKPAAVTVSAEPAAAPIMVPLRVVKRKVLVPDTRVLSLPAAAPQLPVFTAHTTAPVYQAPAPVYTQSMIAGRDNRLYIMVPSNAVVPSNAGTLAPVNSYVNYFAVW